MTAEWDKTFPFVAKICLRPALRLKNTAKEPEEAAELIYS